MKHDPHKNYSPDWGTPEPWAAWVRRTMGRIDLDPASCPTTNDVVRAERFFTQHNSGLDMPWTGFVYCNPPGCNSVKSVKSWWSKGVKEYQLASVSKLVWCFFNNEHLRHVNPSPWRLDGYMVIPRKRIGFISPETGKVQRGARNWGWFWSSCEPDPNTPIPCWIVKTGPHIGESGIVV